MQLDGNLWDVLRAEVDRLTSQRPRGVNFSEDFAVDRVCAALDKLQQSCGAGHLVTPAVDSAGGGELRTLRAELACEEQRLAHQQAKIDEARIEIEQAKLHRAQLESELDAEETRRRRANEAQAKQWREAALRTHLCLASIRAKEQERTQLQAVASTPPSGLVEVREGILKKMQAEVEKMKEEVVTIRRELEEICLERTNLEIGARGIAASPQGMQGSLDRSSAGRTGCIPDGAAAPPAFLGSSTGSPHVQSQPHAVTTVMGASTHIAAPAFAAPGGGFVPPPATSGAGGIGLAEPMGALAPIGRPTAAAPSMAGNVGIGDAGAASKASDNARSVQAAMTSIGGLGAPRTGVAPSSPIGSRSTVPVVSGTPTTTTKFGQMPSPGMGVQMGMSAQSPARTVFGHDLGAPGANHAAHANQVMGGNIVSQRLSVLDEAQRVLDKMDSMNARRGPSVTYSVASSTVTSAMQSPMVTTFAPMMPMGVTNRYPA